MTTPPGVIAVLIASENGAASLPEAISHAVKQAPVFVVSDGSTDATPQVAVECGARVLALSENVGKPAALRCLLDHRWPTLGDRRLPEAFEFLIVIDDDTVLEPGFVRLLLDKLRHPGVAAVGGMVQSSWREMPNNPWVAARSWATWRTQLVVVRGQAAFNARTWISGASTGFRASVLDEVCRAETPYIVDDTYWCWEIHRNRRGKVRFQPAARCRVQEPLTLRALYRQDLRWTWGGWQGIFGHRAGRRAQAVDVATWLMIFDLLLYVVVRPALLFAALLLVGLSPVDALATYVFGYIALSIFGAFVLRNWRLPLFWPALMAYDWMFRVVSIHGFIKAIRQPTINRCAWESPARYEGVRASAPSSSLAL